MITGCLPLHAHAFFISICIYFHSLSVASFFNKGGSPVVRIAIHKVDGEGRIVIPNQIRRELGLKKGDYVTICFDDRAVMLKAERKPAKRKSKVFSVY